MNEKQMRAIDQIAGRWAQRLAEEEKARLQRAVEALKSGSLSFLRNGDEVRVINGESSYMIRRAEDRWVCSCPDFQNRGKANGWRCKHLLAYFLAERVGLVAESPNGHAQASAHPAQAPTAPEPQEQPEAQATPTGEGLEDPVMPFGRHRGKRLSQILAEAPDDLLWIVRKMEARSEADQALKEAAAALVEQAARERAEAILRGEAEMPTLPFGEEKGKALDKAHPKWVAILSKKTVQDAFTFADAVLYETARLIHSQRQQERRKKTSALDTQVFLGALRQVILEAIREAVPAALEAAREQEADREALLADLADLRRRVERMERALSALRHVAEREAALAAR